MSKKIYSEKLVAKYLLNVIKEAFYVETKTTGKLCTEAQVFFQRMLKEQGIETYVLDVPIHNLKELQTLSYKTY